LCGAYLVAILNAIFSNEDVQHNVKCKLDFDQLNWFPSKKLVEHLVDDFQCDLSIVVISIQIDQIHEHFLYHNFG
jgi:hypothetical protein